MTEKRNKYRKEKYSTEKSTEVPYRKEKGLADGGIAKRVAELRIESKYPPSQEDQWSHPQLPRDAPRKVR